MLLDKNQTEALRKMILKAARIPFIILCIGITLTLLSFIDDAITPLTRWRNIFDITDKVGNFFIVFAIVIFIYELFTTLLINVEKKISVNHKVASVVLLGIRKSLRVILVLTTISIIIAQLEPTQFYVVLANNLINIIIIGSIGWIAIQILYTIETALYHHMLSLTRQEHIKAKAIYTKMRIIRNIGTVVIIIISSAAILMSFNSVRNIGISLLASAGFLTAIIGLSAQKTLFSLFSGLQIILSQTIKIGDVVVIEDESGIIEEITFTYVTIKLGDKRRLIVPINFFIDKPFENWSREGHNICCSLKFNVDFMMPIEALRTELDNVLDNSKLWDGDAKTLQVSNLTDKAVEIRIQISAANADDLADLRSEVREKLLTFIQDNYPSYFPNARFRIAPDAGSITA
jgi:small-conductance mechanosensitive channel